MRFGYVMDVYMPKSKDNKAEHRGFGFVTYETEAAIQRVVGHGAHRLKGSTIAIDIAMPKVCIKRYVCMRVCARVCARVCKCV
jgi:RNA-binding protein Musashi